MENLVCDSKKLQNLDAQLNQTYTTELHKSFGEGKIALKRMQKLWLSRRFQHCRDASCAKEMLTSQIKFIPSMPSDFTWLREFKNKDANQLLYDPRWLDLIAKITPDFSADFGLEENETKTDFAAALDKVFSGPPDKLQFSEDDRQVYASACRAHSCDEKGLIWVNFSKEESASLVLLVHFIYQGNYSATPQVMIGTNSYSHWESVPESVLKKIKEWLKANAIVSSTVRFRSDAN